MACRWLWIPLGECGQGGARVCAERKSGGAVLWLVWLSVALASTLLGPFSASAVPERLLEIVPEDAIAAVLLDGVAAADGTGASATAERLAGVLLRHTRELGLLHQVDAVVGVVADAVSLHPQLAKYPRAVVLGDMRVKRLASGGFRLAGLGGGLVIVTGEEHAEVAKHVQALLNIYADSDAATLSSRQDYAATVHRLVDRRLPDWAVIEWGAVGDCYVIALGEGSFGRLAATASGRAGSLGAVAWVRGAHQTCRGHLARWEWYVDVRAGLDRLSVVMAELPGKVLEGLWLGDVSRGLWTVGPDCRAVDAACLLDLGGRDRYVQLTVTGAAAAEFDRVIPPEAKSAAVIRARPRELIPRACRSYLAARSPSTRHKLVAHWEAIEARLGINFADELLAKLGEHVIIHDYPKHPLRLPLLRTILIELRGPSDEVRASIDRLGRELSDYIAAADEVGGLLQLNRDADGVWYLQCGLYGPGLAVTDRWIVVSYSPQAVRRNVEHLRTLSADKRAATTRPGQ